MDGLATAESILADTEHRYYTDAEFHARVTLAANVVTATTRRPLSDRDRKLILTAAAVGLAIHDVDIVSGQMTHD